MALRPALLALLLLAPAAAAQLPTNLPVPVDNEVGDTTVYPTWPMLTETLKQLAAAYPDVLRLHSAGTSAKGFDLWLAEVADFENPDKVPLAGREVLWVDGGTHASEYSGVMFVLHLLKYLVEGYGEDDNATWMVENRHTFIMPLLNPEGSMNGIGRLNDNLVNINRNYPVGWGDLDEGFPFNNPGPYPASEAETQVAVAWWKALRPDYMASIHCCGNLWLYPYGIEGRDPHPDDAPMFARICDEAFAEVREDCGPIWSTIYPASGSSVDTAYEDYGAAAFGYEMSGREGSLPFTQRPIEETESESWAGVLHAFRHVEKYGAHPAVEVAAASTSAVQLRITNEGWANLTRGTLALTDASGAVRQAALPWLAPGASAPVSVPGAFGPGGFPLEVAYLKRPFAPEGHLTRTLSLARDGAGLVGAVGGAEALRAASLPGGAPTPLGAEVALVALAAIAVLARRRA